MWEFFTEWSSDDPKYYVILIILGTILAWLFRHVTDFRNEERGMLYVRDLIRFLLGVFLILTGLFFIIRDLVDILF